MSQESQPESIARFQRDVDYFESHYAQLLQEHPEQWVAIFNQTVVGTDSDFDALLDTLEQAGIPIEKALIEHVTAEDDVLILPTRSAPPSLPISGMSVATGSR